MTNFLGGISLKEAFENAALALSDYISEIETVEPNGEPIQISVKGFQTFLLF